MDILTRYKYYLVESNKSKRTTSSYLSHLNRIIEKENIQEEDSLINRVGFINYKIHYSGEYNNVSEKTRTNYCSALNSFFGFVFEDFEFISIKTRGDDKLSEEYYDSLLRGLNDNVYEVDGRQIKVQFAAKQVKKGCLIWTIAIVIKGVKNGFRIVNHISKIIKAVHDSGEVQINHIENAKLALDIATDLLSGFFSMPNISSIFIDSVEISKELFKTIKGIKEQTK